MTTRRDFLKGLSALAAAVGIAPKLKAAPPLPKFDMGRNAGTVPNGYNDIEVVYTGKFGTCEGNPYESGFHYWTDRPDIFDVNPTTGTITARTTDLPVGTYHGRVFAEHRGASLPIPTTLHIVPTSDE
jgi:hypothetical protein